MHENATCISVFLHENAGLGESGLGKTEFLIVNEFRCGNAGFTVQ